MSYKNFLKHIGETEVEPIWNGNIKVSDVRYYPVFDDDTKLTGFPRKLEEIKESLNARLAGIRVSVFRSQWKTLPGDFSPRGIFLYIDINTNEVKPYSKLDLEQLQNLNKIEELEKLIKNYNLMWKEIPHSN